MNSEEFKKVVAELKERPMPGKHVYVWNGDEKALVDIIGKELTREFDLAKDVQLDGSYDDTETYFSRLIEKAKKEKPGKKIRIALGE